MNKENSHNNKNLCENCKHFDELKSEENNLIISEEIKTKTKILIFFMKIKELF